MPDYNFNRIVDRRNTNAIKWMGLPSERPDLIPMGVADMDFQAPPEVLDAMRKRIDHGIFGYTSPSKEDNEAIASWVELRHNDDISDACLMHLPGVVCGMRAAVSVLTKPGDTIVVQTPVHTPFFFTASHAGRVLAICNLLNDGHDNYAMNYVELERMFARGVRMMLLCSPQNPMGRVWTRDELLKLVLLCRKYNVILLSDETHRDLVAPGVTHVPMDSIPEARDMSATFFSPAKTFNFGGMCIATAVTHNSNFARQIRQYVNDVHFGRISQMDIVAQTAAYQKCAAWLDQLRQVLDANITCAMNALEGLPVFAQRPQCSFLIWLNLSKLRMTTGQLDDFLVHKAGIRAEMGSIYQTPEYMAYNGLEDHIRLNLGMPPPIIEKAMRQFRNAVIDCKS